MGDKQAVISYLATLASIVVLTIVAAIIVANIPVDTHLAQIVAALGFIGAAVTGLIGVIGTFKPRTGGVSEDIAAGLMNKVQPTPEPQPYAPGTGEDKPE